MSRTATVHYRGYPPARGKRNFTFVSRLVLTGRWLERLGFSIGQTVSIECTPGKLIITVKEV